ncbi:hypothetical protein LAV84_26580 [Rhizobium sp. VS19-DR104.2]|uniref:hypothetical protein n=1 Tax=unclassified Rhizobium TaxID=2613769 RepID=UPI001CC5FF35|nr:MULTISPECIES: hypothetical protein [unclassified Rhizobium]MBZ5763105.1 hypothetical protein [Rhizobium sp. VS19-DR96]MBZ5769022.1 hypothetical protein [Rhizobium sp. VS19-DR129.2]MBZ5776600.1 hypothetical protein [Rhizobium sp. VS19-DRK62.2]MBZ5787738.1 hypothetical protein [Rhizobium sp. VS19-DR121]MBZ5805098.1 hypothetical protein [Rhizobium sp. VS19-DR181]
MKILAEPVEAAERLKELISLAEWRVLQLCADSRSSEESLGSHFTLDIGLVSSAQVTNAT